MVDQGIASMAGASTLLLLGAVLHSWNLVTLNHLCMPGFVTSSRQFIPGFNLVFHFHSSMFLIVYQTTSFFLGYCTCPARPCGHYYWSEWVSGEFILNTYIISMKTCLSIVKASAPSLANIRMHVYKYSRMCVHFTYVFFLHSSCWSLMFQIFPSSTW